MAISITAAEQTATGTRMQSASVISMSENDPNSHSRTLETESPENTMRTVCTAENTSPITTPDST